MSKKPTIILVNDCDHMSISRAKSVFSYFNHYDIPFTNAIFNELESHDEYPKKQKSLAKHCRPIETCSIVDKNGQEYIDLLKKQIYLGNEIAYHGNSQISNSRNDFLKGIKNINNLLGIKMTTYIEHGGNPKSHAIEGCKKETLAMLGSKEDSDYYVFDLLSDNFKQAWCYFDLIELSKQNNFNKNYIFKKNKKITFFKRARAFDILRVLKFLNKTDDVCVFYTHFGYDGYPRDTLMESWNNARSIEKNCIFLKKLQDRGFSITTVQDYFDDQKD